MMGDGSRLSYGDNYQAQSCRLTDVCVCKDEEDGMPDSGKLYSWFEENVSWFGSKKKTLQVNIVTSIVRKYNISSGFIVSSFHKKAFLFLRRFSLCLVRPTQIFTQLVKNKQFDVIDNLEVETLSYFSTLATHSLRCNRNIKA